MISPTFSTDSFFDTTWYNFNETNIRLIKISRLAPKTATLFGVMPNSDNLNNIAESAIPFTTTVKVDSIKSVNTIILFDSFFVASVTENKMIAITPISKTLKISKKFLSL